jgi:hypothetical protein
VIEVVEESKEAMAFCTERVACSLADILDTSNVLFEVENRQNLFPKTVATSNVSVTAAPISKIQGIGKFWLFGIGAAGTYRHICGDSFVKQIL